MKKSFPYFIFVLLMGLSLSNAGCNNKPAYSDIKVEQPVKADSETAQPADKPADPVAEVDKKAQAAESQPATPQPVQPNSAPSTQPKQFEMPKFFDTAKGEIKDIPKYPTAQVSNMQYGPLGESIVVFQVLQSGDPIEKIAAYYASAVKRNGWTIVSNTHDAIFYEWTLKKGDADEATVKITKEESQRLAYIALTRTEKKVEKKP